MPYFDCPVHGQRASEERCCEHAIDCTPKPPKTYTLEEVVMADSILINDAFGILAELQEECDGDEEMEFKLGILESALSLLDRLSNERIKK